MNSDVHGSATAKRPKRLPGLTVKDGYTVHPFDERFGVRTSGLVAGRHLKSGHRHDRHYTAYFGVAPSVFVALMRRWRRRNPKARVEETVFLDIGANVGIFSLLASKVSPSANILAFEPTATTFELLSRNIQLNDARNVTPLHLALGNFSGHATLHLNVSGKDGLNTLGKLSRPDTEAAGDETVPITTLDDYLRSASLGRIDLMNVDAEGAELSIFEGASSLLQRPDAPMILYEAFSFLTRGFDYHPVEIFWLLERLGFSFFTLNSDSGKLAVPEASRAYDSIILAVKPSHPAYSKVEDLAR